MTKSSPLIWQYVVSVKSTVKVSSILVAFLENTNFKTRLCLLSHISLNFGVPGTTTQRYVTVICNSFKTSRSKQRPFFSINAGLALARVLWVPGPGSGTYEISEHLAPAYFRGSLCYLGGIGGTHRFKFLTNTVKCWRRFNYLTKRKRPCASSDCIHTKYDICSTNSYNFITF